MEPRTLATESFELRGAYHGAQRTASDTSEWRVTGGMSMSESLVASRMTETNLMLPFLSPGGRG